MSKPVRGQSLVFKGIYSFDDPSGALIAAKVPTVGSVDLYAGTAVIVKPHQCALFIYEGKLADVLLAGTHRIESGNVPLLTRLANWSFGFESPLRAELVFIAGHVFTARRWGTPQPVLANFQGLGTVPIRAFGNFNLSVTDPKAFYMKLFGTRSSYAISDLEDFVQGQIVESLPQCLTAVSSLEELSTSLDRVSKMLEGKLKSDLAPFGVAVNQIQLVSALPSQEVLEAMEAKTAIRLIGSQREYLLYKAANSLGQPAAAQANDPLQMMMGLMLGKGLLGADYHDKERVLAAPVAACSSCGEGVASGARFCASCGKKVAP